MILPLGAADVPYERCAYGVRPASPLSPPRVRRPPLLWLRVQSESGPPPFIRPARTAFLEISLDLSYYCVARMTFRTISVSVRPSARPLSQVLRSIYCSIYYHYIVVIVGTVLQPFSLSSLPFLGTSTY